MLRSRYRRVVGATAAELDTQGRAECVAALRKWRDLVLGHPQWFGFSDIDHAQRNLDKPQTVFATEVCHSMQGHFLVDGEAGEQEGQQYCNQLGPVGKSPVAFLSMAGIDFGTPSTSKIEAPKYFIRTEADGTTPGPWSAWKQGGQAAMLQRLRTFYGVLFTAAQQQGVRCPVTLPVGLGVYLAQLRLPKEDASGQPIRQWPLADDVAELYFTAQFGLLAERDWGFDTYFLNPQEFLAVARRALERRRFGSELQCNVVLHDRDAKFIASRVASVGGRPGYLNPSDARAVCSGCVGMYWERGRGVGYVGEEDFAATSTGVLGDFNIAGNALGLNDVSLLTETSEGMQPELVRLRPCRYARPDGHIATGLHIIADVAAVRVPTVGLASTDNPPPVYASWRLHDTPRPDRTLLDLMPVEAGEPLQLTLMAGRGALLDDIESQLNAVLL